MTSQKGTVNIILLIIIVALVAALLYLVAARPGTNPTPTPLPPTSSDETAGWKTYRNDQYGFQMTLTEAWKGYDVTIEEMSSNFGAGTVVFWVPTKAKYYGTGRAGFAALLKIHVYNPEYWQIVEKSEGPQPGFLAKNSDYVFAYSSLQDPPNDLVGINFELAKVLASFQLTSDETAGWRTYANYSLGIEFKYPAGEVVDGGTNAYFTHTLSFAGIELDVFTDRSVNNWDDSIQDAINKGEPVGDPAALPYSISVKNLLTTKSTGYDCTTNFGEYLTRSENESCQIVDINGVKAFKIVATGPFQSEISELKYIFYRNNTWFDASLRVWIYDEKDPNKRLYTFEQLNAILQGKVSDPIVKAEVDLFNQILSTFKFTE